MKRFRSYVSMGSSNNNSSSSNSSATSTTDNTSRNKQGAEEDQNRQKIGGSGSESKASALATRLGIRRARPPKDTTQVLVDLSNDHRRSQRRHQHPQPQSCDESSSIESSYSDGNNSVGILIPPVYLSPASTPLSSAAPTASERPRPAASGSVTSTSAAAMKKAERASSAGAAPPAASDYQRSKDMHRLVMLAKHPNPAMAEHYSTSRRGRRISTSKRTGGPVPDSSSAASSPSDDEAHAEGKHTGGTVSTTSSADSNGSHGGTSDASSTNDASLPPQPPLPFTVVAAGEMGEGSQEEWPMTDGKPNKQGSNRAIAATFSQSTDGSEQRPHSDDYGDETSYKPRGMAGFSIWVSRMFSNNNEDLASLPGRDPSIVSDRTPRVSNVSKQRVRHDVERGSGGGGGGGNNGGDAGLASIVEGQEDEDRPRGIVGWFRSSLKSRTGKVLFGAIIILILAAVVTVVAAFLTMDGKGDDDDELGLVFVPGSRQPRPPTSTSAPSPGPTIETIAPSPAPTFIIPTAKPTLDFLDTSFRAVGQALAGDEVGQRFGYSVVLSEDGTIAVVGSPFAANEELDFSGQVQAYQLQEGRNEWTPIGLPLRGRFQGDQFGSALALSRDGRILAVSEPTFRGTGIESGNVRTFRISDDGRVYLPLGQELSGLAASDLFGASIALSGDGRRLAIGAPNRDTAADGEEPNVSGQVRVYELSDDDRTWRDLGSPLDGSESLDRFGWAVDFNGDGTKLIIGAPRNLRFGGYARCYEFMTETTNWRILGEDITNSVTPRRYDDFFGYSVAWSSDGDRVAVGAPGKNFRGLNTGVVAVYDLAPSGGTWDLIGSALSLPSPSRNDQFGFSIDLENDILLVGVPGYDSVGQGRMYKFEQDEWIAHPTTFEGGPNSDFGVSVFLTPDKTVAIGGSAMDGSGPGIMNVFKPRI